eukprot:jgi/Mesvir1/23277/Mv25129-RA.1
MGRVIIRAGSHVLDVTNAFSNPASVKQLVSRAQEIFERKVVSGGGGGGGDRGGGGARGGGRGATGGGVQWSLVRDDALGHLRRYLMLLASVAEMGDSTRNMVVTAGGLKLNAEVLDAIVTGRSSAIKRKWAASGPDAVPLLPSEMAVVAVAVKLIGVLVAGDELVGALAAREGIPRALAHTLQMCLFHLQRGSTQGARCGGGSGGGARSGGGANNNGGGSSAAAVASDRPRPPTMWVTLAIVRLAKVSQRALSSLTLAFGSVATLASLACLDTLDAASRACVSHGLVCLLQSFRGENAQSLAYESLMAHKGSPPASAGAGSIVVGAPGIGTLLRLPGTLQGRVVPSSSAAASSRSPSSPPTDNSPPHEPIWCDFPGCVVVNVAKVCLQVMAASRPRVVSAQAQAQVQSQAQAQAQARHRVPAAATAVPGACMPNSSLSGHGVSSRGGAGADGSSYENGSDSALVVGHAGSGSAGAGNYHGASVQVGGGGGGGAGLVAGASSNSYGGNGGGVASRASSDPASLRYNAMAEAGRVLCWLLLSPRSRCILRLVRERGGLGLLLDLAEMQCCSCETRCLAVEAAVRVARVDGSASNNGANSGNGSNGSGTAGAAAAGHGALEQARRGDGQGAGAKGVVAREER